MCVCVCVCVRVCVCVCARTFAGVRALVRKRAYSCTCVLGGPLEVDRMSHTCPFSHSIEIGLAIYRSEPIQTQGFHSYCCMATMHTSLMLKVKVNVCRLCCCFCTTTNLHVRFRPHTSNTTVDRKKGHGVHSLRNINHNNQTVRTSVVFLQFHPWTPYWEIDFQGQHVYHRTGWDSK